jgi:hypothetical protein
VVNAIIETAAEFYEKYGFKRLPDTAGDVRLVDGNRTRYGSGNEAQADYPARV